MRRKRAISSDAPARPALWRTKDGRVLAWEEMTPLHLINAAAKLSAHAEFFRQEGYAQPERMARQMRKLARRKAKIR